MPFAVRIAFSDAFGFLYFRRFLCDLFVHAACEGGYAVAVCGFFVAHFGEEVVPDSECDFKCFWFKLYDFYFSQATVCESLDSCFQEQGVVSSCFFRYFVA